MPRFPRSFTRHSETCAGTRGRSEPCQLGCSGSLLASAVMGLLALLLGLARSQAAPQRADGVTLLGPPPSLRANDPQPLRQSGPARVPLPKDVSSLEVVSHDAPIAFAPAHDAARRGSAQLGARLPIFDWEPPRASCNGRWFLIGPQAWICESSTRLSSWPPQLDSLVRPAADGLPYRYYFVGSDGSFGYATLRLAEEGVPDSQLEPGFSVAVRRIENKPGGEAYGLTTHGLWLPMRDLQSAVPSRFRGAMLTPGRHDIGWTYKPDTRVYSAPRRLAKEQLPRLHQFEVLERAEAGGTDWLRVNTGQWLRASDVRRLRLLPPPDELLPGERWLAVDTERQILVAYEGEQPVFATLVSTGRGTQGTTFATPKGNHRIWVKLVTTDMTNLEQQQAGRYYAIEEVPWVMFFKAGYGLHGAFWHDSFGTGRSHGCVNLSPWDAHFLFEWAGPRLPAGWHAVHPTTYDRGTLVVVH